MDRSFDLLALLKERPATKSHKVKPTQFVSVAGGVQKRLETNIKYRKSSRLSVFDRIRNISRCESPARPAVTAVQQKAEHRKQQLEKWKEEKEKKKKEAAAQKKKPFVAGVAHRNTFGPPPPAKPLPSTSGRVTRSQALKQRNEQASKSQSFAPNNAVFKPPQFKASQMPTLGPVTKKKTNKPNFTFEPVLHNTVNKVETRATRSKTAPLKPNTIEAKVTRQSDKNKPQPKNKAFKAPPLKQHMFQSSSSSDMEQPTKTKPQPKSLVSKVPPLKQTMLQSSSSSDIEQPTKTKPQPKNIASKPPAQKHNMFQSTSSSDMEERMEQSLQNKTSEYQSSGSDMEQMKEPLLSEKSLMSQSSSSSDIDQSLGKTSVYQSSSSSDVDQQVKKLEDATSTSEESEQEIEETIGVKSQVPKSESPKEEKLRSPKSAEVPLTPEQIFQEAENISPYVTMSRGKANARKEMKKKLEEGLLDEDNSDSESVEHFRRQLNSEITRITAMCEAWDAIFAQTVLPEPVQESVLTAVGQARLLMSQKMQQFAALVEACAARAPGAALVTPADLLGFWDMLFMQVENVDMRFKKLEQQRARGWAEEPAPPPRRAARAARASRPAAAAAAARSDKPAAGPNRLRQMIAAARKAKKQQESQSSEQSDSDKSEATPPECKTFEAGFFSVSSPVKRLGSAPSTPANKSASLLKAVLSSEARKASAAKVSQNSTSFAMLRASMMSKNVDIEGISPLMQTPKPTPLRLDATPSRSILKPANPASARRPEPLKSVLFRDSDDEQPPSPPAEPRGLPAEPRAQAEPRGLPAEPRAQAAGKENRAAPKRRSRLSRQNAEDHSPVLTRSRRQSARTPQPPAENKRQSARTPQPPAENKRQSARTPQPTENKRPARRSSRRRETVAS